MTSPGQLTIKYLTLGFVMLALFSALSPMGHSATSPSTTLQHDSLLFTVNPDRSVSIGWNTTTTVAALKTATTSLPTGLVIQSSSSFSQQTNAVVETTTVQYQFPQAVYTQIPYSLVNSVSLNANQTGTTGQGTLTVSTGLPVQSVTLVYSTSSSKIEANATAQIYFNSNFASTPFANQTIFKTTWAKTFGNATWTDNIVMQIQNATQVPLTTNHVITVTAFNGTVSYPDLSSAVVKIGFIAVPSGSATDFVSALENTLSMSLPSGLDNIIRSAMNLATSESTTLTYTGSTGKLVIQSKTSYVNNLDSQVNSIKNQFFQYLFLNLPAVAITPSEKFLNATSVTVSKISTTSNLDLNAGTESTALTGLLIGPPTVGTSGNFTVPGLFQLIGSAEPTAGINITIAGGSDSSNQVKVVVPAGTPTPNSSISNSHTWYNVNASVLSSVRFLVQPLPTSIFAFLTSPTGIIIEAVVAAAVIASIALLVRRRRSVVPVPTTPSGPVPSPGFGPSPAPPTQSTIS